MSAPEPSTASGASQGIGVNPTDWDMHAAPQGEGQGDCTLSNTRSCREEEAISVVLVNMKPLVMPNTRMDTMLPEYAHWYTLGPESASTVPTSHVLMLL